MRRFFLLLTAAAVLTSCSDNMSSQQEKAGRAATAFAEAYFNYDFTRAVELTTPETSKWIRFAASSISQENVDMLNTRSEGAVVTLSDCQVLNDTICEVLLEVDNYLAADSIGHSGVFRHNGEYLLTVVLRNGQWQVRMAGLLRNGKHSRD